MSDQRDGSQFTSTKTFTGFPCAHRQWKHPGHCKYVHGYSRSFHFIFACDALDECGFVVDFGSLGWLKEFLEHNFDHTLLIPADDPFLREFQALHDMHAVDLRVLPYGVSMEGTARFVYEFANDILLSNTNGRARIEAIEVRENEKNSATYYGHDESFAELEERMGGLYQDSDEKYDEVEARLRGY